MTFGAGRLLAAGVVLLVVAVGLTVRHLVFFATWPEVETTVVSTRIIEEQSGGNGSHALFRPEVTVRYAAGGTVREGRAVATYWSSNRADAEQKLTGFSAGERKLMRYDPSNPSDLRFDVNFDFATFKVPLLSAAGGVLCLTLWLALRRRRES